MIEIIKELKIEVSKPNIFQAVVAKQYDMNTRFIKATLVDGTDIVRIPSRPTVKAIINAERPDGLSKGFDGEVNSDGTVTVPLHSWMLELEGTVICDISIVDTAADDNKKLTTTAFTLLVEKAAYGGEDVTNDPQYDVLVSLLETCSEASAKAEEALEKSNEALEKSAEADAKYEDCVQATEDARAVRQEIEEGGFVESLKETNNGAKFSTWIGTHEEYEALEQKLNNCMYIVTDDPQVDYIVEQGTYAADETTNFVWIYRKWASGLAELWMRCPMTGRQFTMPLPFNLIDNHFVAAHINQYSQRDYAPQISLGAEVEETQEGQGFDIIKITASEEPAEGFRFLISISVVGKWK